MGRPKTVYSRIAEEIGISRTSVRRALAEAGMSELDAEQDFERAVEIVEAINDKDKTLGHNAMGRGEGNSTAYADAKAQAELYRAEKLRLQNARLAGQLIDREAATETVTRVLGDLRVALLSVGVRLAPKLSGQSDNKAIARLIEDELHQTLTTFADPEKMISTIEDEALE